MSAQIVVQSGISAGTSYWIERPVTRIGSDPELELCLLSSDLDGHALTLEFREGHYRVYNRGANSIQIGRETVATHESAHWRSQEVLQLDENRLVLEIDGDPSPSPRPAVAPLDALPDDKQKDTNRATPTEPTRDASKARKAKSTLPWVISGICLVGVLLLLLSDVPSSASPQDVPSFESLVTAALESESTSRLLIRRLQDAEATLLRGNSEGSAQKFMKIRDDLLKQRPRFRALNKSGELAILDYVQHKLNELR